MSDQQKTTINLVAFDAPLAGETGLQRQFGRLSCVAVHHTPQAFVALNGEARADVFLLDATTATSDPALLDQCLAASRAALRLCVIAQTSEAPEPQLLARFDDFIFWPCEPAELQARLWPGDLPSSRKSLPQAQRRLLRRFAGLNLVGQAPAFVQTLALIDRLADSHAPVLLQGETGTGKENAARSIHYLSPRRERAFVPINCGAIPDELFESELFGYEKGAFTDAKQAQAGLVAVADEGTLFLDEVDSLSLKAQAALLRFLQNQEYRPIGARQTRRARVRVVAATNSDLQAKAASNDFREDLFYRLHVLAVKMPPLRERVDDIPLLAERLLDKFAQEYQCAPKRCSRRSLDYLMTCYWQGNVRELENFLLREFLLADGPVLHIGAGAHAVAMPDDGIADDILAVGCGERHSESDEPLVDASMEPGSFQQEKAAAVAAFERDYLQRVLALSGGNISAAARLAGKERRALGKLIKKHDIDKSDLSPSHAGRSHAG